MAPQIVLNPLTAETEPTPFGPIMRQPSISAQLVFAYIQQRVAAINARVANPTDKTIVIPAPATPPSSVSVPTPFGPINEQIDPDFLFILAALGQESEGINAVWNS